MVQQIKLQEPRSVPQILDKGFKRESRTPMEVGKPGKIVQEVMTLDTRSGGR